MWYTAYLYSLKTPLKHFTNVSAWQQNLIIFDNIHQYSYGTFAKYLHKGILINMNNVYLMTNWVKAQ